MRIFLFFLFCGWSFCLTAQEITYSSETYATLQEAVDALEASGDDSNLLVLPIGEYQERVNVSSNLTIRGAEVFATRWSSADSDLDPLLQISGNVFVEVERITFLSANVGISLSGVSQANIHNNIFAMGSTNTAIFSIDASSANLYHNSFHNNGIGFLGTQTSGIMNNIFHLSDNSILGLSSDNLILNNHFEGESADNRFGTGNTTGSVNFIDADLLDLHLELGSPAIDAGGNVDGNDALDNSSPDLGAYGGNRMDRIPVPVSEVELISSSNIATDVDIIVRFASYDDYQTQGFLLHYDTDSSGEPYAGNLTGLGLSPVDLGASQTVAYNNLDLSGNLATGNLLSLAPRNGSLIATWEAVDTATAYEVRYRVSGSSGNYQEITTGVVTSTTITGLTNGVDYEVQVRALYQPTLYIAVSSYYDPAQELSSRLSSSTAAYTINQVLEGSYSSTLVGTPEETLPYPILPDNGGGCLLKR